MIAFEVTNWFGLIVMFGAVVFCALFMLVMGYLEKRDRARLQSTD